MKIEYILLTIISLILIILLFISFCIDLYDYNYQSSIDTNHASDDTPKNYEFNTEMVDYL